jgi:hypothetical protein
MGAYAYLDSVLLGRTPIDALPLPAGPYRVWFRSRPPDEFEPLPLPARRFALSAGESLLVQERVGRLLTIESEPEGAGVFRGRDRIGTTPLDLRWFRDDDPIRLEHAGYHPRQLTRLQLAGSDVVRVDLSPLELPSSVARPRVVRGVDGSTNWRAWGAVAVGGVAAGLAIHFKDRADRSYGRYRRVALASEMDRHLDDANRYDGYSTVAWVITEGSFLLALWLFAHDALRSDVVVEPRPYAAGQPVFMARWRW